MGSNKRAARIAKKSIAKMDKKISQWMSWAEEKLRSSAKLTNDHHLQAEIKHLESVVREMRQSYVLGHERFHRLRNECKEGYRILDGYKQPKKSKPKSAQT